MPAELIDLPIEAVDSGMMTPGLHPHAGPLARSQVPDPYRLIRGVLDRQQERDTVRADFGVLRDEAEIEQRQGMVLRPAQMCGGIQGFAYTSGWRISEQLSLNHLEPTFLAEGRTDRLRKTTDGGNCTARLERGHQNVVEPGT